MFVTIHKVSGPRGSFQGAVGVYFSSALRKKLGKSFVIRQDSFKTYIRQSNLGDRDLREVRGSTSFVSSVPISFGRHSVIKKGDNFIIQQL